MAGRKRKLYKYDQFDKHEQCFYGREVKPEAIKLLTSGRSVVIELGAGNAMWSRQYAVEHPEDFVIAFDIKRDRLWQGARESEELENIIFINASAEKLLDILPKKSVDEIWITFPDPFFKKSQMKRRLSGVRFLEIYAKILKPEGSLSVKSDNQMFLAMSVEYLAESKKFEIERLETELPEVGSGPEFYQTYYEQLWRESGQTVNYLVAKQK